jgi:hypothetical protein
LQMRFPARPELRSIRNLDLQAAGASDQDQKWRPAHP